MRVLARQMILKTVQILSRILAPLLAPEKEKGRKKEKEKKRMKDLCYERKTCRLVAEELRINVGVNEKRSKILSGADGGTPKAREILEPKVKIPLHTNCVP